MRQGRRVRLASAAVAVIVAASPLRAAPRAETAPSTTAPAVNAGGIPLQVKQAGHCSALAPADWAFTSNPQSSTAEAWSPDRSLYAGWGVTAINRAQQRFYGDLYGDPETSIRFLTTQILGAVLADPGGMRYVSAPQPFLGTFTLRSFESNRSGGHVFFRIYPGPGPGTYVESVYFAMGHKDRGPAGIHVAAGVAVSIRCVTQLVPSPAADVHPKHPGAKPRAGCGTGGNLRGYQKELGTQYAHSPSTGQNFLFDASTQWKENGPQGPGYYRPVGNSYEKLELGRSDDC